MYSKNTRYTVVVMTELKSVRLMRLYRRKRLNPLYGIISDSKLIVMAVHVVLTHRNVACVELQ